MMRSRRPFPKEEKLKSKKDIQRLFNKGKSLHESPLRIIFSITKAHCPPQVAISIPKKNVRLAINRNTLKRRIKEAYRLHSANLKQQLKEKNMGMQLILIYTGKQIYNYKEIESKIKLILERLSME